MKAWQILGWICWGWLGVTSLAAQTRVIRLEILVDPAADIGIEHKVLESLSKVGADNVKISRGDQLPENAIQELPGGGVTGVKVYGVVQGRTLIFPRAKFGLNDHGAIRDYLQNIRVEGAEVALADKLAFGLTAPQLVALHEQLAVKIAEPTRGVALETLVNQVVPQLAISVTISAEARALIKQSPAVTDELKGVSAGSALAAALRPAGLVLVPIRDPGKPVALTVARSDQAREFWPVGWPSELPAIKVLPKLWERIDVEIDGFQLADALNALAKRLGTPLLYDHNGLAEKEVEPSDVAVTFVKRQASYNQILDKLLAQTKPGLRYELRVDEAGQPFLWVY